MELFMKLWLTYLVVTGISVMGTAALPLWGWGRVVERAILGNVLVFFSVIFALVLVQVWAS